jgi:hypothetical protein
MPRSYIAPFRTSFSISIISRISQPPLNNMIPANGKSIQCNHTHKINDIRDCYHQLRRESQKLSSSELPLVTGNIWRGWEVSTFPWLTPSSVCSDCGSHTVDRQKYQDHGLQQRIFYEPNGMNLSNHYELPARDTSPPLAVTTPTTAISNEKHTPSTVVPHGIITDIVASIEKLKASISRDEDNISTSRNELRSKQHQVYDLIDKLVASPFFHEHPHGRGHTQGSGSASTEGPAAAQLRQEAFSANLPNWLNNKEYMPNPDLDTSDPNDPPDTKRCVRGAPRGRLLRKSDRYYQQSLCDKHGNESLFKQNMEIHGTDREREYAWMCS